MQQSIIHENPTSQHQNDKQKELYNIDNEDCKKQQVVSLQVDSDDQQNSLIIKSNNSFKKSPYLKAYIKQLVRGRCPYQINQFQQKLWKHKIVYLKEFHLPLKFQFSKTYESRNKKIMQFEVRFSYFIVRINVLNICPKDNLNISLKNWINSGVYGAVYEVQLNDIKYAVKKISLNKHSTFKDITNAIQQYSIMKLCSALEIGPAYRSLFGFDLIITQDSIYFSCQMGVSVYDYARSLSNNLQHFQVNFSKLEQSLIFMHSLGIIHNDIKPNNIIFSETYEKFCFIDFGLSEVTQNLLGTLKKVKPRGSLYYCSQEMKKLFFNNFCKGEVDLYHNDMIALQKSKQSIISILQSQQRTFMSQQRQINCQKVNQMINDDYNILNGTRDLTHQQKIQQNENNNLGYMKQIKQHNNNDQLDLQTMQCQIEMVLVLRMIFYLQEKKVCSLQQLIQVNRITMLRVLSTNLKRICFIFFQGGKSPALYKLYKKLLSYLSQSDTITNETIQIVQLKLQPYFRNIIDRQGDQSNIIIERYMLEQKQSKQIICKRYQQTQKLFYNDNLFYQKFQSINGISKYAQQSIKQIIIYLPFDVNTDIQPVLNSLKQSFTQAGISFLTQTIYFHISKIDYYRVWSQVTEAELGHFEVVLNKLGLKIKFQIKKNLQQELKMSYSQKYVFYLQIFIEFYFIKVKQYHLNKTIGRLILHEMPLKQNINLTIFKDLYQVDENQHSQQKEQFEQKNNIKKDDNNIIEYFRYSTSTDFQIFQLCLNIIDRLIKTLDGFLSYEINIEMNKKFIILINNKIKSCLLIQLILLKNIGQHQPQKTIYVSAHFLNKLLLTKCLQFRRRTIYQKLSKAQQFNDFINVIQSYQSLYNIWDLIKFDQKLLKSQTQYFKIKQFLDKLIKKVLSNSQSWYKIEKQLFEVFIYTALIPFQQYEKFNLLKKYYEIFRRQNSRKDRQKTSSYAQYYAVSKTFKLAIQLDDFNTIINIFEFVESRKSYVMNPRFTYSIYYFFKKCNNSKKIRQCIKSMSSYRKMFPNDDVLHYDFQQRITKIAMQTNKEKLSSTLIGKNQQINQLMNLFTQTQDKKHFQNDIKSSPFLVKVSYQLLKQWKMEKCRHKDDKQIQTRLFNLRFILKRIFYSPVNMRLLFKYLSREYQLQVQRYEVLLCKKIEFLRQRKKIKSQIWKFFGQDCLNEDQYWQKVKLSFILLARSRLLHEITKNMDAISSHKIDLILKEWQSFDLAVRKIASIELVDKQTTITAKYPSLLTYYQLQAKINRVLYLNELKDKNNNQYSTSISQFINKKESTYIESLIQYLKRAIIRFEKLSNKVYTPHRNFKYFQTENILKNATSIITFRCEESFMDLLCDCCQGIVKTKDLQKQLEKHKILKIHFESGFNPQNQLKKTFFDIVQSQQIHMFFYLYHFRIRFMQNLIELGAKLILQGKKQEEMGCYFLTFMFYHICEFVKKYNCSSYSYLIVGMINSFQEKLLNHVFLDIKHEGQQQKNNELFSQTLNKKNKRKTDYKRDMIIKLRLITLFQEDIIKFFIDDAKQQKIQHSNLILLSCQRIKFEIILFLTKNKFITYEKQIQQFECDLSIIRKIQFVVCDNGDKLEYLAKMFFKHTFYCYLMMLKLSDRMFNLFQSKLAGWLAFGKLNHTCHKLQIKHFRSTRRISTITQQKQQQRRLLFSLEQKYYYLIFEPINQQSFKKLLSINKIQQQSVSKNNNIKQHQNLILVKIKIILQKKLNRYLQISCSNSV